MAKITFIKLLLIIVSIVLALSGCGGNGNENMTNVSNTDIEAKAVLDNENEISLTTVATTTTAIPHITETITEAEVQHDRIKYPDKLYVEDFISQKLTDKAENIRKVRENFSKTNEFFDFKFISDPVESIIPEDVKEKAVALAADERAYKEAEEKYYLFDTYAPYDMIASGEVSPEFNKAFEFDYDGEPGNERFIMVSLPQVNNGEIRMADLLIFENSSGDMNIVGFVDCCTTIFILDYGSFKHFIFGGTGLFGIREHIGIYGVISGTPKEFINNRIWIDEESKKGCFLYHSGIQGYNELMVYDTTTEKYRTIYGYPADNRKLKELDVNKDIEEFEKLDIEDDSTTFFVVGEKYLLGRGGVSSYIYENGRFIPMYVLGLPQMFLDDDSDVEWFDVDVDYAFSSSGINVR